MKYLALLMLFLFSGLVVGQKSDNNEDRIKALKIAYLTDKMELTPETSKKFWPIYNEYNEKRYEQKRRYRPKKDIYEMNAAESKEYVNTCLEVDENLVALSKKFHKDLESILSPEQIARWHAAEYDFKKKILKSLQEKNNVKEPGEEEEEE